MSDARNELNSISKTLLQIHKLLLTIQKEEAQDDDKEFSPHELLQALFSNPEFEWLRTLSTLVARIDEVADDKTADHGQFLVEVIGELRDIFTDSTDKFSDFKNRLENALPQDADLQNLVANLRRQLEAQ